MTNKPRERLLSIVLSMILVLTSTVTSFARANGNNFMSATGDVTKSVNFLKDETYDKNQTSAELHPGATAMRISLVYSEDAGDKAGIPVHDANIIHNPINVANANVYWKNPTSSPGINPKKIFVPW